MSDRYSQLVNNPVGEFIAKNVGLPRPFELERWEEGQSPIPGKVLLGAAPGGRLTEAVASELALAEAAVDTPLDEEVRGAAAAGDLDAGIWNADAPSGKYRSLVFDATGIDDSAKLRELWAFFHPSFRGLEPSGRVLVLGTPPEDCKGPREATAQRALEGFTRSLAKEARAGATAQLVYVSSGAETRLASTLRFFLSPRSAYVSGQVVRIGKGSGRVPKVVWDRPLEGKVALVTGASRGIGESIARTLARDGAHVVGLDIPPQSADLEKLAGEIGGSTLALDITADDAPSTIATALSTQHGGVDIVVHNAGVTKDKTIVGMDEERWSVLLDINLSSEERINDALLDEKVLNEGGRVICVSSISGIAGNAGQTNYGTSKAGVIGMVDSMAPVFAKAGATINAVAPGFIETQMTAAMPIGTREAGRRLNSLSQGGLPVDVAETIAWYASPASSGLNGNLVRVCGQSLIGA
ncbi:MAG TPA: 3-oxoacyl-ACP reductase [Solirubrobacterales bacterium]|nr:3-oxoacyl-ACP reductase [Solirubrobacterales bacterium]